MEKHYGTYEGAPSKCGRLTPGRGPPSHHSGLSMDAACRNLVNLGIWFPETVKGGEAPGKGLWRKTETAAGSLDEGRLGAQYQKE